jgi:hypothetical protein
MDSKLSMNMGDNRAGTVLGNVKTVAADIDKLISSALANSARIATNAANSVQGYWSSRAGQNQSGSSTTVMSQPIPNSSGTGSGNNPPSVMANAGGSSGFGVGLQRAGVAMGYAFSAMPGVQDQVVQNQLATRAGFFGYGSGNRDNRYNQAQGLQGQMNRMGLATSTLDPSMAMITGQGLGIGTALRNYNSLAMGVAGMSATVPGVGMEGTMQAYAGLQQGRTVNLMRAMGVSSRDAQGNPRSYTDIANQLWSKLNREKSKSGAITKEDIANSLLPGNALDNLLNQVAGGNSTLRSQLEAAIYAKASGAKDFSRGEMQRVGGISDFTASMGARTAAAAETLYGTSIAGAAGAEAGNVVMTKFSETLNKAIPALEALAYGKGFLETSAGGGNGIFEKLIGSGLVKGLLSKIPGLATGGAAGAKNAYMVGENGPELFIPNSDGKITSNETLRFAGFRHHGGTVNAADTRPSGSGKITLGTDELEGFLKQAGFRGTGLVNAMQIAKAESGNRPYAFNPIGGDLSYGLFQINMLGGMGPDRRKKFGLSSNDDLYDPLTNAKVAYAISKGGTNWNPWTTAKKLGITGGSAGTTSVDAYSAAGVSDPDSLKDILMSSGRGGPVNNYGGVTINIQGDKDPKKTAETVVKLVQDQGLVKRASSS